GDDPLPAVLRKNGHAIPRSYSDFNQARRNRGCLPVHLAVGDLTIARGRFEAECHAVGKPVHCVAELLVERGVRGFGTRPSFESSRCHGQTAYYAFRSAQSL